MPYRDATRQREAQRAWKAARRAEFVAGQICARCGSSDDLELHHRDRSEKVSHKIWSWSRHRIVVEVAKCEWLCGSCHDKLHAEERRAPCGTDSSYRRGCRCADCRRAHTEVARASRERRKKEAIVADREAWIAVVQDGDAREDQETELVTLERAHAEPGATIELTDGRRITLLEPAA